MPRLLLNATTLQAGGALQVATNFITQATRDSSIDWHFAVSKRVYDEVKPFLSEEIHGARFHVFMESPAKNIASRRALSDLARTLNSDAVFTLFGPAYVRFQDPHLMGFADGWLTHPNSHALATKSLSQRFKFYAERLYKSYWVRQADAWVTECDAAKEGVQRMTGSSNYRVGIVQNGCRDEFKTITTQAANIGTAPIIRALYISSYYAHKNFEMVPRVAHALVNQLAGKEIRFVLTLDPNAPEAVLIKEEAHALGVINCIDFVGRVSVAEASRLYESSHLAFIPTLLESFSATYSEALTCGLPILTTDLPFATTLLGDAALYFKPSDATQAAAQIMRLINDPALSQKQTERGRKLAATLPDSTEKYRQYRELLGQLCNLGNSQVDDNIDIKAA